MECLPQPCFNANIIRCFKIEFHVLILNILCLDSSKWDVLPLDSFYNLFW